MWFFLIVSTLAWGIAEIFYKKGSLEKEKYSHLKTTVFVGIFMGIYATVILFTQGVDLASFPINLVRYLPVALQATGHRETIKIEYDEAKVSPMEILETFFNNVDPYDFEGQFIDKGYSYTLAFYYEDDEQKKLFEKFLNKKKEESGKDAAIAIEPYKQFYEAEAHHQKFCMRHPEEFEKELIESGRKKK